MKTYIQIHPSDTVAVALTPLAKATSITLPGLTLLLKEDIPRGHKFALKAHTKGDPVIKYGNPIGTATQDIPAGAWVHTHNMKTGLGELLDYTYTPGSSIFRHTPTLFSRISKRRWNRRRAQRDLDHPDRWLCQ